MKKLAGVLALYALTVAAFQTARHWRRPSATLPPLSASERAGLRDSLNDGPPAQNLNGSDQQALDNAKAQAASMPDVAGQPVKPQSTDAAAGCSYVNLQDRGGSLESIGINTKPRSATAPRRCSNS